MAAAEPQLKRANQPADHPLPARAPKKRMLVIVNPYATTVSDRLKNLVLYALQARYDVEEATSGKWEQARLTVAPRALRALG